MLLSVTGVKPEGRSSSPTVTRPWNSGLRTPQLESLPGRAPSSLYALPMCLSLGEFLSP